STAPQSSRACRATSWWRGRKDWTGQGTTVALGLTSAARPIGPSTAYPSMPAGRWGHAGALPASNSSRLDRDVENKLRMGSQDPLDGWMRPLLILSLALIAACDPGRGVIFQVSPLPSPTADSARLAQSLEIARGLAEKYQMQTLRSDNECRFGRYFSQDSIRGRKIGLNFCV